MARRERPSVPNYGRSMKLRRKHYREVTECSNCGNKDPMYRFRGQDGKMKGACSPKCLRKVK